MIIQCPQCQSRFKLPTEKIKTGGAKVRCTKCKSKFFVTPPEGRGDEASGQKPALGDDWGDLNETGPAGSGSSDSGKETVDYFGEDFDAAEFFAQSDGGEDFFLNGEPVPESAFEDKREVFGGGAPFPGSFGDQAEKPQDPGPPPLEVSDGSGAAAPSEGPPESIAPLTLAEEDPPPAPAPDFGRDYKPSPVLPIPEPLPSRSRRKHSLVGPLLTLLLLMALGAGGFLYSQGKLPESLQPWKKKQRNLPAAVDLRPTELSGYHVVNSHEGPLFVVQGKVVNHGAEARAGIQVAGFVYDGSGAVIARQAAYCGNPLSRSELRSFPYERMTERMNNQFGEVLSNINIEPNKSVPFIIVFKGVPEELAEFGVEVVDSKPVVK